MIEIRPAYVSDAANVQILIAILGYKVPLDVLARHLDGLASGANDRVLLASENEKELGLIAIHWTLMLHMIAPVARITALVVAEEARGRGIGRMLVDRAAEAALLAGCEVLELTSSLRRSDAHAFYKALGFEASSTSFRRSLA